MPATDSAVPRLTNAELLELGREIEPGLTERSLELWRSKGLLPNPERTGQNGKKPIWSYPVQAADQLKALLTLRLQTKSTDVLRVALWFDGFPINIQKVRESLVSELHGLRTQVQKELSKYCLDDETDQWDAIERVATEAARKRGGAVPRLSRQSLDERSRAIALLMGLFLGEDAASEHLKVDAFALEGLMGVERGRRVQIDGSGPWLDGAPEVGFQAFSNIGNIARLIEVAQTAPEEQLSMARSIGRILTEGLRAFSQIADAIIGRDNAVGMAAMELARDEVGISILLVPLITSALLTDGFDVSLKQLVEVAQSTVLPLDKQVKALAAMSEEERSKAMPNFDELPFDKQTAVNRLIAERTDNIG